jgi:tetratricopeptide (TPR) repeat protein
MTWPRKGQPQPRRKTDAADRQICADRDITGIASSGDQAVNIQNRAERITVLPAEAFTPMVEVDVPPGLTNLPERPRLFVGRAAELARLDAALAEPDRAGVQAVHGLGGIGKSTLVARWAAHHADRHALTWWITADGPAEIDAGLASLARALQPTLADVLTAEALRDRAVQWLASHQGWLMVLDNVSDPADIASLLARVPRGRYLITSRRATGWHNLAQAVHLDVLDPAEALDLLTRVLPPARRHDPDGAMDLCAELGFLPLAVEQAGAYISEAGITPRKYLALLRDYPAEMYAAAVEGGDAERTIGRIWHITLDRLADEPLTGQILRLLAWYAPDAIPRTLLDGLAEPPRLVSAIGRLAAYSMLIANPENIAVHRLVQAVARTPEPGDQHRDHRAIDTAREQAIAHLATTLPEDDPPHWLTWRTLLPHINALASHASPETDGETSTDVFQRAGIFALGQGQVAQAAAYLQRAFTSLERILGSDHVSTTSARHNLAAAYVKAGDPSRANPMLEQSLADRQRVLPNDDPDVMAVQSTLAWALVEAGDLSRAIPMLEQSLADRQRVLPNDDPHVMTSRNNLARAYQNAKDLGRAIALFEQNLTELARVLGNDHPRTLTACNNLAAAYMDAGDPSRAVAVLEKTLANQERILGSDHPDTLDCRNDLARAYQGAGDLGRAIPLTKQTLADRQRVLGNDHPAVMISRNNLARAYQDAKDFDQAISLFNENLAELERVLGSNHTKTLAACYSLGGAYLEAGNLSKAIRLFKRSLADQQKLLGIDHPDTLASRHNLAAAYLQAGNPGRAIGLFEQNLADQERVLGADHTDTLTSRHSLACALLDAGNLDQAIVLFEQTGARLARVLGVDHPDTLASRHNLARAYLTAGYLDQAFPLLGRTLADCQRLRGRDHPDTLTSRSNLAIAYCDAGELDRAIPLLEQVLADRQRVLGNDHPDTLASRRNLAAAINVLLQ